MSAARLPKVAGIDQAISDVAETDARAKAQRTDESSPSGTTTETAADGAATPRCTTPAPTAATTTTHGALTVTTRDTAVTREPDALEEVVRPFEKLAAIQDQLASWISDLTTLHEFTERLTSTATLETALQELLRTGAALVGARRGLVVLDPSDGFGPRTSIGYGLPRADLGTIETVPRDLRRPRPPAGRRTTTATRWSTPIWPTRRASTRGTARSPPTSASAPATGCGWPPRAAADSARWSGCTTNRPNPPTANATWPGCTRGTRANTSPGRSSWPEPAPRWPSCAEELLPSRLPRVPGMRMAVRHRPGARGGGDWYDALPLPEGALGLSVGGVTGSGPSAVAAMGRLRASLRAYAVMEGEDPVAVLSDLELLLRLTEPARTATALFAYVEPAERKTAAGRRRALPAAGGGRAPAPSTWRPPCPRRWACSVCWEAPSVEFEAPAARPCCCTPTGCCTAPASPPTGPSRSAARGGGGRPAGRCARTRRRWSTTCCGSAFRRPRRPATTDRTAPTRGRGAAGRALRLTRPAPGVPPRIPGRASADRGGSATPDAAPGRPAARPCPDRRRPGGRTPLPVGWEGRRGTGYPGFSTGRSAVRPTRLGWAPGPGHRSGTRISV